jgi:co-chaperonin GroES (HSP10)
MIHRSSLAPVITSFDPIGDRVLLRRHERPEMVGQIVLPSNARFVDLAKFTVIKCGPKCESVKPGDIAYAPAQLAFGAVTVGTEELEVAPEKILSAFSPQ